MLSPIIPQPGQHENDFLRWIVEHPSDKMRRYALACQEGAYARALYSTRPDHSGCEGWEAWYDALTPFQRALLDRVKGRKRQKEAQEKRELRAKQAAEEGRTVRQYRRGLSPEQRKEEDAARKRAERAALAEAERKRRAREEKRKQRAAKRTTPAPAETARPALRLVHSAPAAIPQDVSDALDALDALDLAAPVALVAAMATREGGSDTVSITASVAAEEPAPAPELTLDEQLEIALRPEPAAGTEIVADEGEDDLDEVDALYREIHAEAPRVEPATRPTPTTEPMRNPNFLPRQHAEITEPKRRLSIAEAKEMLAAMQERKHATRAAA